MDNQAEIARIAGILTKGQRAMLLGPATVDGRVLIEKYGRTWRSYRGLGSLKLIQGYSQELGQLNETGLAVRAHLQALPTKQGAL